MTTPYALDFSLTEIGTEEQGYYEMQWDCNKLQTCKTKFELAGEDYCNWNWWMIVIFKFYCKSHRTNVSLQHMFVGLLSSFYTKYCRSYQISTNIACSVGWNWIRSAINFEKWLKLDFKMQSSPFSAMLHWMDEIVFRINVFVRTQFYSIIANVYEKVRILISRRPTWDDLR